MKKLLAALFAITILLNGLAQAGPSNFSALSGDTEIETTPSQPPQQAKSGCGFGGC